MKKVLLLLAKGFEMYEASVFTDVFGWNHSMGDGKTELTTCGIKNRLQSSFNIKVETDQTVDMINVDDYDAVAVPGGFEEYGFYEDAYNEKFLELIRKFDRNNKIIASVCVGALPIGKSGALVGKKATTYNLDKGLRQGQLSQFGVDVINEPIVIDTNIITSWNPSTAIDVALKLLELLTTKENSDYIRRIMGFTNYN